MPVYGIRMNMIVLLKSEIIKEERKRKKKRETLQETVWCHGWMSPLWKVYRPQEARFCFVFFYGSHFHSQLGSSFSLSLPNALVYTIWQLYFSCSLPALVIYIVSCTVITNQERVGKFTGTSVIFLLSALHFHMGGGGSLFPAHVFLCLLEVQTASD